MPAAHDLTSRQFGSWTVISKSQKPKGNQIGTYWVCKCKCGKLKTQPASSLVSGASTKCRSCYTESRKTAQQWIKKNQGKHYCKCGCNKTITIKIHHHVRGIPDYLNHHRPNPWRHHNLIGRKNPHYKTGKHISSTGYVRVLNPSHGRSSYFFEHRLIMESHIGRKLMRHEVVHHVNGNKTDNRLENLQLMQNCDHSRMHAKNGDSGFGYIRRKK